MCCTPTITFDKLATMRCGKCGKEFVQPLPESGTHQIIERLILAFEEHTQDAHDCVPSLNSLVQKS